jgi:hypothetical protein
VSQRVQESLRLAIRIPMPCLFCENPVRYVIDFSIDVASPKPPARAGDRTQSADGNSQAMLPESKKRKTS